MKYIFIVLLITSCATSSNKGYMSSADYTTREDLTVDYLNKKEFKSEDINELLSHKINIKRPLKMAVVKLGHLNKTFQINPNVWAEKQDEAITKSKQKSFENIIETSQYIKDVSLIPQFLMPEGRDFKSLRRVAALMQADLLLILKANSQTDYDFNLLTRDKAKALATVEAVVLDVRTGVIPFTSVATGVKLAKKASKDFSNNDFKRRATLGAEDQALKQISQDIAAYFN